MRREGRLIAARDQAGWIGGQIMIPLDGPNGRVIIGTWQTRAHWEAWQWWHEVIEDIRRTVTPLGTGEIAA